MAGNAATTDHMPPPPMALTASAQAKRRQA
jgi:hypothetical protein